jgi:hypothetical protein
LERAVSAAVTTGTAVFTLFVGHGYCNDLSLSLLRYTVPKVKKEV